MGKLNRLPIVVIGVSASALALLFFTRFAIASDAGLWWRLSSLTFAVVLLFASFYSFRAFRRSAEEKIVRISAGRFRFGSMNSRAISLLTGAFLLSVILTIWASVLYVYFVILGLTLIFSVSKNTSRDRAVALFVGAVLFVLGWIFFALIPDSSYGPKGTYANLYFGFVYVLLPLFTVYKLHRRISSEKGATVSFIISSLLVAGISWFTMIWAYLFFVGE